jgi:hypothetical protein
VLYLVIAMLASLLVAGFVVLYVAFPHRGEKLPAAPWLGDAMARATDRVPVIDEDEGEIFRLR